MAREMSKEGWKGVMLDILGQGRPEEPALKVFKPKVDLPVLDSYEDGADPEFWTKFPKNLRFPGKSIVDPDILEAMLLEYKVESPLIPLVLNDLRYGAALGCRGDARKPTRSGNAPSALEFGRETTDAVAAWVLKGFVYGPVDLIEVPAGAKINGIMCKLKPNGAVRVILNMSAPKGRSVNDGIRKEDFPAPMSSTTKFLRILCKGGPGCLIFKCDWADAYKHVCVCDADVELQWFCWLDKYFAELCLVFGGVSSVGLYDRLAKFVGMLVRAVAKFPADMMEQHLDDNFGAAPAHSTDLHRLDESYQWVADRLGVKLAPRDDPEKSFAPCHKGVILGVEYDTISWTWSIPQVRLDRILLSLFDMLESDSVDGKEMESLVGKIIHVRPLVPDGRFHIDALLKAQAKARRNPGRIEITECLRNQLTYWRVLLPVCSGRIRIPDPDEGMPAWTLEAYSDAAGGSMTNRRLGLGAVCGDFWAYVPWSRCINFERDESGKSFSGKMSLLEMLGPLLVVSAGAAMCEGQPVRVWVDNSGAVHIWRKGYSPCPYVTSVARAAAVVARGINCKLDVVKITRCSNRGSIMADALSKGALQKMVSLWTGPLPDAARVPRVLLKWLGNPVPSDTLGEEILAEIL